MLKEPGSLEFKCSTVKNARKTMGGLNEGAIRRTKMLSRIPQVLIGWVHCREQKDRGRYPGVGGIKGLSKLQPSEGEKMTPGKIIVTGTSRSGKSTLVKRLKKNVSGLIVVDVFEYVKSLLKQRGLPIGFDLRSALQDAYEMMYQDFEAAQYRVFDVVEIAPDFPYTNLPAIAEIVKERSKLPATLIYIDTPVDICLQRNEKEKRKVPERVIIEQSRVTAEDHRNFAEYLGLAFLKVDGR